MKLLSIHHRTKDVERLMASERRGMLQYACYRLGNLDDAEDAVQDVFVRLHQRLNEGEAEVRNLTAYLYRTLANLCISRQREAGRMPTVPIESQPGLIEPEAEDFEQEYRRISRLLAEIPDEQAEVIRLRFYGDKSFQEIADILGIPLTTAKSRFTYGLEKIRRGMRAPHAV
ncbi:MAG: RNA polymerase sigma factor [Bacteroidaceae bacterium]|nr:RNA polymerase sigma factor [Bacteroidaceae bacterium]